MRWKERGHLDFRLEEIEGKERLIGRKGRGESCVLEEVQNVTEEKPTQGA